MTDRGQGNHGGQVEDASTDVRPLPVLAEARPLAPAAEAPLPTPVAAAAGGFVAGLATLVLVRMLRRSRPSSRLVRPSRRRRRGRSLEVTGSRSFLVDVHLLKK